MNALRSDIAYCLRRLARAPGFSISAIGLLTVALTVTASIFSVTWCMLFKPLPFVHSEQLALVMDGSDEDYGPIVTPELVKSIAHDARTIQSIAAFTNDFYFLDNGPDAETTPQQVAFVQPQIFAVLGLHPIAGRIPNDDDAGAHDPGRVLVNESFAKAHFGNAQAALGRSVKTQSGKAKIDYDIIGVMADDTPFALGVPIWKPMTFYAADYTSNPWLLRRGLFAVARVRDSINQEDASEELTALLLAQTPKDEPNRNKLHATLIPLRFWWTQGRALIFMLMLGVALLLLAITTINIVNLYIARLSLRRHEHALLSALGSGPARDRRLHLLEAALIAGTAAALALLLAPAGLGLLDHFALLPAATPFAFAADHARIALIAALAVVIAAILFLASHWLRRDARAIFDTLKTGGTRQTATRSVQRLRIAMIVAQIALTCALLFGSALLFRSARNLLAEDVGFKRDHLITTGLALDTDPKTYQQALLNLADQVRAIPEVSSVSLAATAPFVFNGENPQIHFRLADSADSDPQRWPSSNAITSIDSNYFSTLQQPILAGRSFSAEEAKNELPVAVVDSEFAKRVFADGHAIGKRMTIYIAADSSGGWHTDAVQRDVEIVGVVGNVKIWQLDEQRGIPMIYLPGASGSEMLIRTRIDPALLERPLKQLAQRVAPDAKLGAFFVLKDRMADMVASRYRLNSLLELLGAITLALAGIGLYAVLAYSVRMRRSEFGIRLALGAAPARVTREVLTQGLRLVAIGLALGLPLACLLSRLIASQLYRVSPFDPLTLLAVSAIAAVVGTLASWWPARNAARVDPMTALRQE